MPDPHLIPLYIFGTLLVTGFTIAVIISLLIQKQRQVKNRLARQQLEFDYSKSLLNTRIEVRESTLNMLAQELHDNIMQALTGCFMEVSSAATFIEHDKGRQMISDAKEHMRDVIRDVRLLSHSLATGMVERRDLQDAIQAELTRIQTFTSITCTLHSGSIHELLPDQRLLLFRVVQESLQNALKYAEAKHISIAIDDKDGHFFLTISDDGKGFDVAPAMAGNSLGLTNIQERVAQLKGNLVISSAPGQGTTIKVRIPVNPAEGDDKNSHRR